MGNLSQSERYLLFSSLNTEYNGSFDVSLQLAFSDSLGKAIQLYDDTSTSFVASDISVQTPVFFAIVDQIQQIEEQIGKSNQSSSLMKILADICLYQCANK